MLTHRAKPSPEALQGHQIHYWLGMLREALGIADGSVAEDCKLEAGTRNLSAMRVWLAARCVPSEAPLIAIAPAAAYGPAKEWPLMKYARLIDLLGERHGAKCVLVGAPAEQSRCQQVRAATHAGAFVAAGETSVGELIALLSLCDGFVGNDSGAMHLAAALALPTVGIFGSTNPARTGPTGPRAGVVYHRLECSPCLDRICRFGHYQCLWQVSAEEVSAALAQLGAFAIPRN
jgi:heptosyltransferase-2